MRFNFTPSNCPRGVSNPGSWGQNCPLGNFVKFFQNFGATKTVQPVLGLRGKISSRFFFRSDDVWRLFRTKSRSGTVVVQGTPKKIPKVKSAKTRFFDFLASLPPSSGVRHKRFASVSSPDDTDCGSAQNAVNPGATHAKVSPG